MNWFRQKEVHMRRQQRFEGIVQFLNPHEAPRGVEALAAVGCKFERDPDMVDACGPTIFGLVTGTTTELDENALWNWLQNIIEPLDGEVWNWAFARSKKQMAGGAALTAEGIGQRSSGDDRRGHHHHQRRSGREGPTADDAAWLRLYACRHQEI